MGLHEEVDFLRLEEPRPLRLAWSALRAHPKSSRSAALAGEALPQVTPQELFMALDGRGLTTAGERFRLEVFSVRDEAGIRWVQLALNGSETRRLLTLRLKTGDNAQHAIFTLAAWLADPAATPDVFNVA